MTYDFTPIMDAARVSEQSQNTVIRLLVQALDQLERRVRDLEDDYDNAKPKSEDVISDALEFERNVLSVIECNNESVRIALDFEARVLSVIEENSYTTFTHLEAEIDEKLDQMTQSYGFAEAVEEAVKGSIVSTVEDVIAELGVIDPEEIVRAGLKAII